MPATTTGFGPDLPRAALLALIDDVTGKVPAAHFQATGDAAGYMTIVRHDARYSAYYYSVYHRGKHLPAKLMPARLLVVPTASRNSAL